MSLLKTIHDQFPIRRSEKQKAAFRKWLVARVAESGWRARVEENDRGRHQNVLIGDPEHARITFTAHYDTPACIGLPDLRIPRNFPVYFLHQAAVVGGMLLASFGAGLLIALITGMASLLPVGLFLTFLLLMLLMLYGPANRANANDNTSGVAALLALAARVATEDRRNVAFIFFDNAEKGCRGAKAYARDHLQVQHTRLVVDVDCIGVGEHMLFSVPALAKNMPEYAILERLLTGMEGREVHFFGRAATRGTGDYRSFRCGVGVSAYRRIPGVGFYTGDIHTWRDTEADEGNLTFLTDAFVQVIECLREDEAGESSGASAP